MLKKERAGWKIIVSEGFRKGNLSNTADRAKGKQLFSVIIICFAEYYDVRLYKEYQNPTFPHLASPSLA